MLKQRLITAAILIPLLILGVLFLPLGILVILAGLIYALAAWEWSFLSGVDHLMARLLYVAGLCLAYYIFVLYDFSPTLVIEIAFYFWVLASILVFTYPRCLNKFVTSKVFLSLMGYIVLYPSLISLTVIVARNRLLLLTVIAMCVILDSGAYFMGKRFGKRKLVPRLSPGKTWEGFIGSVIVLLIVISLAPLFDWDQGIFISLFVAWFALVGDLTESMLKRIKGVKDSGTILPGHGGILDRIDSYTAAFPTFLMGVMLWNMLPF